MRALKPVRISATGGPARHDVEFMVKDLRKYVSTGGWGFA
jgi:hypothetical protein